MAYKTIKVLLLLWLILPKYSGAQVLHVVVLDKIYSELDRVLLPQAPKW
jgi:hypothetical protein